jgi:hypothetical protein
MVLAMVLPVIIRTIRITGVVAAQALFPMMLASPGQPTMALCSLTVFEHFARFNDESRALQSITLGLGNVVQVLVAVVAALATLEALVTMGAIAVVITKWPIAIAVTYVVFIVTVTVVAIMATTTTTGQITITVPSTHALSIM